MSRSSLKDRMNATRTGNTPPSSPPTLYSPTPFEVSAESLQARGPDGDGVAMEEALHEGQGTRGGNGVFLSVDLGDDSPPPSGAVSPLAHMDVSPPLTPASKEVANMTENVAGPSGSLAENANAQTLEPAGTVQDGEQAFMQPPVAEGEPPAAMPDPDTTSAVSPNKMTYPAAPEPAAAYTPASFVNKDVQAKASEGRKRISLLRERISSFQGSSDDATKMKALVEAIKRSESSDTRILSAVDQLKNLRRQIAVSHS